MTLTLRDGCEKDAARLMDIHRRAILGNGPVAYTAAECESWASGLHIGIYLDAMHEGGERFILAETGPEAVGFCSYKENRIMGLYVDPAHSRKGIGHQLLQCAENRMVTARPARICLQAALSARDFYEAQGYSVTANDSFETRGGLILRVCNMQKVLSQASA